MEQKRFKSPIVWVGALAQVVLIVTLINPQVADVVKIVGAAVIEIATLFGFLNNPTSKASF